MSPPPPPNRSTRLLLLVALLCLSSAAAGRKLPRRSSDPVDPMLAGATEPVAAVAVAVEAATASDLDSANANVPVQAATEAVDPAPPATPSLAQAEPLTATAADAIVPIALEDPPADQQQLSAAAVPAGTVNFDVIVVGAGLSGLKAAADLQAKNYRVLVLEGRNRIGGRVWSTKMSPTSSTSVEIGAQWFHGNSQSNDVYTLAVNTLGVTPVATSYTEALRYTSTASFVPVATEDAFWTQHDNFITYANNRGYGSSTSVKTAMNAFTTAKGLSTLNKQGLAYTVNTEIEQEFGASAASLSYKLYDEGLNLSGGDTLMPFGKNLSQIPAYLASSVDSSTRSAIMFNQNVTQVAYNSTGVTVTSVSGGVTTRYYAKAAIVTVPLGVLKKRGANFFSPALSGTKLTAVNNLGMGLLNKVILEFPTTYASSGPFLGSVDGNSVWWVNRLPLASGDNGWWQEFFKLSKAISKPVLVAFQAGTPAQTAENTMTDAQTVTSVMAQLRTWYSTTASPMPDPINTYVTRWWNDPWSWGSYSYQTTACTGSERSAFGTPLKPSTTGATGRVWFAGEHTHINYPATMQGAFLSGKTAAAAVAAAYQPTP